MIIPVSKHFLQACQYKQRRPLEEHQRLNHQTGNDRRSKISLGPKATISSSKKNFFLNTLSGKRQRANNPFSFQGEENLHGSCFCDKPEFVSSNSWTNKTTTPRGANTEAGAAF